MKMMREQEIFRKIKLLGANVLVLKVLLLNYRLKRLTFVKLQNFKDCVYKTSNFENTIQ